MLLRFLLRRQLSNDYSSEHDGAADVFYKSHSLTENNEREDDGEDRFGAEEHTRKSRFGVFLTYDLECERAAAAHYTGIEDRNCGLHDSVHIRLFKDEHENAGNNACYHILTA